MLLNNLLILSLFFIILQFIIIIYFFFLTKDLLNRIMAKSLTEYKNLDKPLNIKELKINKNNNITPGDIL